MAWVRIHDGALSHPKLVGFIDWKNPFCVWVWGLSYCQMHLTDGRIPTAALPNANARKTAVRLTAAGLWESTGSGFAVHDYLQWNDSRGLVDRRKQDAKDRKEAWQDRRDQERRMRTRSERVPNTIAGTDNQTKPNQTKERDQERAHEDESLIAVFIQRTYPEIYAKVRAGAVYRVNEARDFHICEQLLERYDGRLARMLEYFLSMPAGKDVLNKPGSPRQFLHMAPVVDEELRRHGL